MMKPLFVQLVPVAPLSSPHGFLSKESFCSPCSCPFSAGILCEGPMSCLFSREKRPNSFCLPSSGRLSSPLIIFTTLLWTLSSLSLSFLNCGNQKCCLTRAELSEKMKVSSWAVRFGSRGLSLFFSVCLRGECLGALAPALFSPNDMLDISSSGTTGNVNFIMELQEMLILLLL